MPLDTWSLAGRPFLAQGGRHEPMSMPQLENPLCATRLALMELLEDEPLDRSAAHEALRRAWGVGRGYELLRCVGRGSFGYLVRSS